MKTETCFDHAGDLTLTLPWWYSKGLRIARVWSLPDPILRWRGRRDYRNGNAGSYISKTVSRQAAKESKECIYSLNLLSKARMIGALNLSHATSARAQLLSIDELMLADTVTIRKSMRSEKELRQCDKNLNYISSFLSKGNMIFEERIARSRAICAGKLAAYCSGIPDSDKLAYSYDEHSVSSYKTGNSTIDGEIAGFHSDYVSMLKINTIDRRIKE